MVFYFVDEDFILMLNYSIYGFEFLVQFNVEESINCLFFFLVFFILFFVGIFVNVYVLYVFGIKIKCFMYWVFVLGFGCIDMFGCIVFIFFQIIDEIYFYIFFDVIFCKIFRFFDINLVIVVVLMFVVIVFERFWKICCLNGL